MTRLVRRCALPALMVALVGRAASAQVPAPADFVLFADQDLKARGLVVDSGDIGANQTLTATRKLDAGASRVIANAVDLDKASTCLALFANSGSATPHCGPRTSFTRPVIANLASACGFPGSFPTACPGNPIVVPHGATLERAAGSYGRVDVAGGGAGAGILVLTGGTYTFCGLTVRRNGQILARAPSVVRVLGKIKFDNGSNVGPETGAVGPCDLQIFSNGDKVRVARRAHLQAFLCAPKAKLELTAGAKLTGAFYAREVKSDRVFIEHALCGPSSTTTSTTPTTSSTSSTGPVTSTSTTTSTTVTTVMCGNGIVESGEECDPPGSAGGAFCPPESGCSETCQCTVSSTTSSSTVPSTTSTLEETTSTSTSTSTTTTTAMCGNGIVESGEECDPPGSAGGAFCPPESGCSETCQCTVSTSTTSSSAIPTTSSTSTSEVPTSSSTSSPSTSSTTSSSAPASTTTTSTSSSTSTSAPIPTTSTSSSSSTSSSTSLTPTTSSTSSSSTSSSTSTSTSTPPTTSTIGTSTFDFLSTAGSGACGNTFRDLAGTIPLKNLLCGSLSLGGGLSQVPDNATPSGATNRFTLSGCVGTTCNIGPTASGSTPAGVDCTDVGCRFGTPLPISNAGLSVCVTNTFGHAPTPLPPSGTLDTATGAATWNFELNSATVLTGNPSQPCPICAVSVGGAACSGSPATPCTGVCDGSPNQGEACQSKNPNGLTSDCPSPNATAGTQRCYRGANNNSVCATGADCPGGLCSQFIGDIAINLSPLTTGTSSLSNASGLFCPGQTASQKGAFKSDICQTGANSGKPCDRNASGQDPTHCGTGVTCRAGTLTNYCSAGTNSGLGCAIASDCGTGGVCSRAGTLAQVISETGAPAGALSVGVPKAIKLGSAFCVGATSNPTVNSNANLPAGAATSVVGTVTLLP